MARRELLDVGRYPVIRAAASRHGYCEDPNGDYAVAWDSETGLDWRRVLEATTGGLFDDVSTDGATGGALIIGSPDDKPLLWTGDVWDGFESMELPTTTGHAWARAVAWDDYRYLAVGGESVGVSESKAVAWLNRGDGSGWQLIDVPAEATEFHDVAGEETMKGSSFVVLGATGYGGERASWRLNEDAAWSSEPLASDGFLELIDPQTGVGADELWLLEGEQWHRNTIGIQMFANSGVRLEDGFRVAGRPNIHEPFPLVLIASPDGRDWTQVDDLVSHPRARIDGLTTVTHGIVGVGDAVYAGPDTIAGYR